MICAGVDLSSRAAVEVEFGDTIRSVEHLLDPPEDLPYVAPGFIDLQVNGFFGVDYCSPTAPHDEIARSIQVLYATGVTRFFPTVITGGPEAMTAALHNLARAKSSLAEGHAMEGFHVEGPHISPHEGARGAHPARWVRPPDIEEFRRWQHAAEGNVKLVTLSPEWPEAPRYIEAITREGVVAAIGHTRADSAQIAAAVSAGATMSTHLGNGSDSTLPRHPNYIWDQLSDDRLMASFIADGIHLPDSFVKAAIRAKGVERSVLVTDAVMPAGCPPGRYKLGELDVELHGHERVSLASDPSRLAGSVLRMDRGIGNLMRLANLSLLEAVTMATRNPARAGRIPGRLRALSPGDRADIVLFRHDADRDTITIEKTWAGGRLVFSGK